MRRLRLFRVLLPLLVVALLVVVVLTIRRRPAPPGAPEERRDDSAIAEGFTFTDHVGGAKRLSLSARSVRFDPSGGFQVDGVDRLEIWRASGTPIVLRAARGAGSGTQGRRVIRLEGGVEVRDDESGLRLSLPSLEVDQSLGTARSLGAVSVAGPSFEGTVDALVYGLEDDTTELFGVRVTRVPDGLLEARGGRLERGTGRLELTGAVRAAQGASHLEAERLAIVRAPDGRPRSGEAEGPVLGVLRRGTEPEARFRAARAELSWDDSGEIDSVVLRDGALLEQDDRRLAADRIASRRSPSPSGPRTSLEATGQVTLAGTVAPKGLGRLEADRLNAELDSAGSVLNGVAEGTVRIASPDASGEAGRASYDATGGGRVVLDAVGERRARVAGGRTRVAADRIVATPDGERLDATGSVEATLLPERGTRTTRSGSAAPFAADEAIHFVASTLVSERRGSALRFSGRVRGWQGERNLSAESVVMEQDSQRLTARGAVSTRLPRSGTGGTSAADFVQIAADALDYDGTAHRAEYAGSVRVRQAEGLLEAETLQTDLDPSGGGIREVRATGAIRFDFRSRGKDGLPTQIIGSGDRLEYDVEGRVVRLFGDTAPAEVRRVGQEGGTTTGRTLRYGLDDGSIEVESGERNRAKIKAR